MKNSNRTTYSLTTPPDWLRARSDYSPWSEGRQKIWRCVDGFFRDSAPDVYDEPGERRLSEEDILTLRLLNCWLHHWTSAGTEADGERVAQSVSHGRGFVGGGNLGGNPFFDLVFADALCGMQNRAAEKFKTDYLDFLKAVAFKIDRRNWLDSEFPDWWTPFFMFLTVQEAENKKPALESFHGYSGLKGWLRISLGHFLRRHLPKERGRETTFTDLTFASDDNDDERSFTDGIGAEPESSRTPEEWKTIADRLSQALQRARGALSEEDWTRIQLSLGEKLQNQAIARLYHEDGSTTSRRRTAILDIFQKKLLGAIEDDPVLRDLKDEIFTTWRLEFGDLVNQFL